MKTGGFLANSWPNSSATKFDPDDFSDELPDEVSETISDVYSDSTLDPKNPSEIQRIKEADIDINVHELKNIGSQKVNSNTSHPDNESKKILVIRQQAYDLGVKETEERMEVTMKMQLNVLRESDGVLIDRLENSLNQLSSESKTLFEPLKRLALHLAEQLVLAELTLDGKAIDRLVQRCIEELDTKHPNELIVELNPKDLNLLTDMQKRVGSNLDNRLSLQSNSSLLPGSVRAFSKNTQIEDLIDHRLNALSKALVLNDARWKQNNSFQKNKLQSEQVSNINDIEDTSPRMVNTNETSYIQKKSEIQDANKGKIDSLGDTLIPSQEELMNASIEEDPKLAPIAMPTEFSNPEEIANSQEITQHENDTPHAVP